MSSDCHVVILGGGITGLSAAFHLACKQPNVQITLVEKSARFGGWIRSERVEVHDADGNRGNVLLEAGPRTIRPNSKSILELVRVTATSLSHHPVLHYSHHRYTYWTCGPRSSPHHAPPPQAATGSYTSLQRPVSKHYPRASSRRSHCPSVVSSSAPSSPSHSCPPIGPPLTRTRRTSQSTRSSRAASALPLRARLAAHSYTVYTLLTRAALVYALRSLRSLRPSAEGMARSCGASLAPQRGSVVQVWRKRNGRRARTWIPCGTRVSRLLRCSRFVEVWRRSCAHSSRRCAGSTTSHYEATRLCARSTSETTRPLFSRSVCRSVRPRAVSNT